MSVLLQAWYEIEYLFTVPEHVFNPPPKVKSAVIKMTRNQVRQLGCNEPLFKRIVKTAFNQRRKTMRNSLKSMVGQDCKILAEPIFNERPERLSDQTIHRFDKSIGKLHYKMNNLPEYLRKRHSGLKV